MKNLFLPILATVFLCSCQQKEEDLVDLDQIAFCEELADHLSKDPPVTPQETLISEIPSLDEVHH